MQTPNLGQIQPLPESIAVLPGTDVDALWKQFRFYEAGHHDMAIMNPLSSDGLDQTLDHLDVRNGQRVLDIACGHGETLARLTALADIDGTGVDVSPWTIRRAAQRLDAIGADGVKFVLGDGRAFLEQHPDERWDVILLLGAPWIWGGFAPSIRALLPHIQPGGQLVMADIISTDQEARRHLDETYGDPDSADQQRKTLEAAGLGEIRQVAARAKDWRDYDDRVLAGMKIWLETFPENASYLEMQLDYETRRAAEADVGWVVWIATVA